MYDTVYARIQVPGALIMRMQPNLRSERNAPLTMSESQEHHKVALELLAELVCSTVFAGLFLLQQPMLSQVQLLSAVILMYFVFF